jgi:hypothetical protein
MIQRFLISALTVLCLAITGCSKGGGGSAGGGGEPPATVAGGAEAAPAAPQREEVVVVTGVGDTELEKIGVKFFQLRKLMTRRRRPYRTIEALGWDIANKSRVLVAEYNVRTRPGASLKLEGDKKVDQPESDWSKLPEDVRQLDLVAINARRLALAAGRLDARGLGESFTKLKLVAERCLPVPVVPEPVSAPQPVPTPAPEPEQVQPAPEPVLPGSEKTAVPADKPADPAAGEKTPASGEKSPAGEEPKSETSPAPAPSPAPEKAEKVDGG